MSTPLKLNVGSLSILITVLNATGWAKDLYDIYQGGRLLGNLPTITPRPASQIERDWANTPLDPIYLTDKESECCIKAIKHSLLQLSPSPWLCHLIEELGITPV
jgi:hypothetical protein